MSLRERIARRLDKIRSVLTIRGLRRHAEYMRQAEREQQRRQSEQERGGDDRAG